MENTAKTVSYRNGKHEGSDGAEGIDGDGSAPAAGKDDGLDYRALIREQRRELEELKRVAREASPSKDNTSLNNHLAGDDDADAIIARVCSPPRREPAINHRPKQAAAAANRIDVDPRFASGGNESLGPPFPSPRYRREGFNSSVDGGEGSVPVSFDVRVHSSTASGRRRGGRRYSDMTGRVDGETRSPAAVAGGQSATARAAREDKNNGRGSSGIADVTEDSVYGVGGQDRGGYGGGVIGRRVVGYPAAAGVGGGGAGLDLRLPGGGNIADYRGQSAAAPIGSSWDASPIANRASRGSSRATEDQKLGADVGGVDNNLGGDLRAVDVAAGAVGVRDGQRQSGGESLWWTEEKDAALASVQRKLTERERARAAFESSTTKNAKERATMAVRVSWEEGNRPTAAGVGRTEMAGGKGELSFVGGARAPGGCGFSAGGGGGGGVGGDGVVGGRGSPDMSGTSRPVDRGSVGVEERTTLYDSSAAPVAATRGLHDAPAVAVNVADSDNAVRRLPRPPPPPPPPPPLKGTSGYAFSPSSPGGVGYGHYGRDSVNDSGNATYFSNVVGGGASGERRAVEAGERFGRSTMGGSLGVGGGRLGGGVAGNFGSAGAEDAFRSSSWADKLVTKREEQSVLVRQLERELASTVSALKDERRERRAQTEVLRAKLDEARNASREREVELDRREGMTRTLMKEVETLQSRCDRLSASREERMEEAERTMKRLKEDNVELEARLRQADAAAAEARAGRDGADAERDRVSRELCSAGTLAATAERRAEQAEAALEAVTGLAQVHQKSLTDSKEECQGLRVEVERLSRRVEDAGTGADIGLLRGQVADLERLLATANQRCVTLEARLGLLEKELLEAEGGEVEARARLRWALGRLGERVDDAGTRRARGARVVGGAGSDVADAHDVHSGNSGGRRSTDADNGPDGRIERGLFEQKSNGCNSDSNSNSNSSGNVADDCARQANDDGSRFVAVGSSGCLEGVNRGFSGGDNGDGGKVGAGRDGDSNDDDGDGSGLVVQEEEEGSAPEGRKNNPTLSEVVPRRRRSPPAGAGRLVSESGLLSKEAAAAAHDEASFDNAETAVRVGVGGGSGCDGDGEIEHGNSDGQTGGEPEAVKVWAVSENEYREPNWRNMVPVLFPPGWRDGEIAAAAAASAAKGATEATQLGMDRFPERAAEDNRGARAECRSSSPLRNGWREDAVRAGGSVAGLSEEGYRGGGGRGGGGSSGGHAALADSGGAGVGRRWHMPSAAETRDGEYGVEEKAETERARVAEQEWSFQYEPGGEVEEWQRVNGYKKLVGMGEIVAGGGDDYGRTGVNVDSSVGAGRDRRTTTRGSVRQFSATPHATGFRGGGHQPSFADGPAASAGSGTAVSRNATLRNGKQAIGVGRLEGTRGATAATAASTARRRSQPRVAAGATRSSFGLKPKGLVHVDGLFAWDGTRTVERAGRGGMGSAVDGAGGEEKTRRRLRVRVPMPREAQNSNNYVAETMGDEASALVDAKQDVGSFKRRRPSSSTTTSGPRPKGGRTPSHPRSSMRNASLSQASNRRPASGTTTLSGVNACGRTSATTGSAVHVGVVRKQQRRHKSAPPSRPLLSRQSAVLSSSSTSRPEGRGVAALGRRDVFAGGDLAFHADRATRNTAKASAGKRRTSARDASINSTKPAVGIITGNSRSKPLRGSSTGGRRTTHQEASMGFRREGPVYGGGGVASVPAATPADAATSFVSAKGGTTGTRECVSLMRRRRERGLGSSFGSSRTGGGPGRRIIGQHGVSGAREAADGKALGRRGGTMAMGDRGRASSGSCSSRAWKP